MISGRERRQFRLDMRHRFDQFACVSGFRIVEHRPALALFDDAAVLQHDGPIAHHANDVEVVADKEEGQIILAPQPVEQLQHHRLHRDIERRRRLVQHQQARPAGDGAGDADTGLLAA